MLLQLTVEQLEITSDALSAIIYDNSYPPEKQMSAQQAKEKVNNAIILTRERLNRRKQLQDEYDTIKSQDWRHPQLSVLKRQIDAIDRLLTK